MQGTGNIANKYSYYAKKVIIVYALVISVVWHVAWMSVFSVNLSAPVRKELVVTQAVFLGDFLQKAYLSKSLGSFAAGNDKKAVTLMEIKHQAGAILPERIITDDRRNASVYVAADEKLPAVNEKMLIKRYTFADELISKPLLDIKGPLSKRGLVYLPDTPEMPQWLSDKGSFNVRGKIFSDNQGRVIFVEQLASTGYLEVDLLVKKYLKKIRFTAKPSAGNEDNQWGIVNVKLEVIND